MTDPSPLVVNAGCQAGGWAVRMEVRILQAMLPSSDLVLTSFLSDPITRGQHAPKCVLISDQADRVGGGFGCMGPHYFSFVMTNVCFVETLHTSALTESMNAKA